ncbi:hypothetical protein IWX90DRAFT_174047 [Phyllosticta citrichinensis]|uniref:Uncharacterized protein n=1 Tax=Phyllosticta citrichinensis TaxID=1130410 RepID=A0ABR1XVH3_9PEZI
MESIYPFTRLPVLGSLVLRVQVWSGLALCRWWIILRPRPKRAGVYQPTPPSPHGGNFQRQISLYQIVSEPNTAQGKRHIRDKREKIGQRRDAKAGPSARSERSWQTARALPGSPNTSHCVQPQAPLPNNNKKLVPTAAINTKWGLCRVMDISRDGASSLSIESQRVRRAKIEAVDDYRLRKRILRTNSGHEETTRRYSTFRRGIDAAQKHRDC